MVVWGGLENLCSFAERDRIDSYLFCGTAVPYCTGRVHCTFRNTRLLWSHLVQSPPACVAISLSPYNNYSMQQRASNTTNCIIWGFSALFHTAVTAQVLFLCKRFGLSLFLGIHWNPVSSLSEQVPRFPNTPDHVI